MNFQGKEIFFGGFGLVMSPFWKQSKGAIVSNMSY